MADEESPSAPGASPDTSGSKVSQWIKNIGALVGVFAALAGIFLSLGQLKEKAEADREAAKENVKAEEIKLDVARLQLQAQREQLAAQQEQHNKDNEFAKRTHDSDFEHQESVAHRQDAEAARDKLSDVNRRMLGNENNAEGDMAVLFNYVGTDPEHKDNTEIVQNAVLARLEDPRSLEEIDIGFRLLERIGESAIEATAQVNRSARRRYDDYLFAKFHEFAVDQDDKKGLLIQDLKPEKVDKFERDVVHRVSLDQNYVFATINRRLEHWAEGAYRLPKEKSESKHTQLDLAMAVIERSNFALVKQMQMKRDKKQSEIDLSDTYLTSVQLNTGTLLDRFGLNLDRAYVELHGSSYRQVPKPLEKAETAKKASDPHSVTFEPVSCALGHSNSQCESQGTLRDPQSLP